MRFGAVAFTDTGHVDTVISPVVGIPAGGKFVVFHLMAVNADYSLGYVNLGLLGH